MGGGNKDKKVSVNLVQSLVLAQEVGAKIIGVVGRDGGFTAECADACIIVPVVNDKTITPHTEAMQVVIWHMMVSNPLLLTGEMKWENTN